MRDMVFIAWGGNYDLAKQVRDALAKNDIDAQVGGDEYDAGDRKYYLGDQILGQMKKASQAIVLAQADMRHQRARSAYGLRPNLMLEWGYLCKSLPAECVHVFLIGLTRPNLPSDLIGSWAEEIKLDTDIKNMAAQIAHFFIEKKRTYRVDPFDVFVNWFAWRDFIIKQISGEQAANPYRLSQVLLHAIRPAYYYNDFKFLGTATKMMRAETAELEQSAELLSAALRYHIAAEDYITTTESERHVPQFESFWSTTQLLCSQGQSLNGKVDPWYGIVNTSYTGMCFQKMAGPPVITDEDSSDYREEACLKFQECIDMIKKLPHKDEYNNIYYDRAKELWLGFAYRNYGKVLCESGKLHDGLNYLELAVSARRKVLNFLDINAIGGDLSTANTESAQGASNILFSQYLLEIMRPMIEIVKFKLERNDKNNGVNYDCRKDIKQFIHIVSDDSCYHQPYIVRQKICAEMKELAASIKDAELRGELEKRIGIFRVA